MRYFDLRVIVVYLAAMTWFSRCCRTLPKTLKDLAAGLVTTLRVRFARRIACTWHGILGSVARFLAGVPRRLVAAIQVWCMSLAAMPGVFTASAAPAKYAGAQACAPCHPSEYRSQSETTHAKALSNTAEHPLLSEMIPAATPPEQHLSRFTYRFGVSDGRAQVSVFDATDVMRVPLDWAFGAGDQAVTFVSRIDRDWYVENHFSFYPAIRGLAATPGQQDAAPKTLTEAVGLVYRAVDAREGIDRCFRCHSTGPLNTSGDSIAPSEPGVHCEACHGPGEVHAHTAKPRDIRNPGRMRGAELNQFCGECHRPPATQNVHIDWNFSWNVRHQPLYFSQSACFRNSDGALSCLTCHNPHQRLRRDVSYYNAVCSGCHARAHSTDRAKSNCVDCHMPRVSPQPPLRFTNHWIGIYASGAHLKPTHYE